jgi:hypothetical protein
MVNGSSKVGKTSKPRIDAAARRRHRLIASLEAHRKSRVISYVLSDRPCCGGQLGDDAVRPMYDHLRAMGTTARIDLFLFTVGGFIDVPWRIVTMIREYASEFNVIVPYKALSAGTLLALGADSIIMGRKGELGPIDPQLGVRVPGGETEQISVEDIMSYVQFIREKAGLTDQSAVAGSIQTLTEKFGPGLLGSVNRVHTHIRSVARKMLVSRGKGIGLDEKSIQLIVETLAEKTYQHGHAIGRREAKDIGLNVVFAPENLEDTMWDLYEEYEDLCRMRQPIDPETFVPADRDEHEEAVVVGVIESSALSHHHTGLYRVQRRREAPPTLNLNLNLSLQLPPSIDPAKLPADAESALRKMLQALEQHAPEVLQRALHQQMPVIGFRAKPREMSWRRQPWPGLPRKR